MIHGVDVSAYQPENYSTAGLDFVIVKATEGLTYTNPRMAAQAKRARDAGLVVGFYHYPHMANDPAAEAAYFLKKAPLQDGDIVVFDWEGYDAANKGVAKSRQLAYRDAWLKYVKGKLPGHKVGMYCNTDYWLNIDQSSNCGDFLWIATAGKAAGQPGITYAWTIHQYSTAGGIDHDVANFPNRAALAAWARGLTPENDVALTDAEINKVAARSADAVFDKLLNTDNVLTAPSDASDYATNKFWAWKTHIQDATNRIHALGKKIDGLTGIELTDAQVTALAAAVAADSALADQIAEKVAEKLAARLAE